MRHNFRCNNYSRTWLALLPSLLFTGLARPQSAVAQYDLGPVRSHSTVQYGLSLKATLELLRGAPNFRFAVAAGVGAPVFDRVAYPTLHMEGQFYGGGLGTHTQSGKYHMTADFLAATTLTTGVAYRFRRVEQELLVGRNQPLYYFSELAQPPLQNPYGFSLSLGSNFILAGDRGKSQLQRVGFLGAHGDWRRGREFWGGQFNYYNDGGTFLNLFLGDKRDRYYTGGGLLAVQAPTRYLVNTLTVSYHKYSGYAPNSFELGCDLSLGYVAYRNSDQEYYNRSYYHFAVANAARGLEVFLRRNNTFNRVDFQNLIHYVGNYAYHQIPYPRHWSVGGSYFGSHVQPGTQ